MMRTLHSDTARMLDDPNVRDDLRKLRAELDEKGEDEAAVERTGTMEDGTEYRVRRVSPSPNSL